MRRPSNSNMKCAIGLFGLVYALANPAPAAEPPDWTQGEWDLNLRYRFEHADDKLNRQAKASTLRAGFTYRSAEVSGFSALAEVSTSPRSVARPTTTAAPTTRPNTR